MKVGKKRKNKAVVCVYRNLLATARMSNTWRQGILGLPRPWWGGAHGNVAPWNSRETCHNNLEASPWIWRDNEYGGEKYNLTMHCWRCATLLRYTQMRSLTYLFNSVLRKLLWLILHAAQHSVSWKITWGGWLHVPSAFSLHWYFS